MRAPRLRLHRASEVAIETEAVRVSSMSDLEVQPPRSDNAVSIVSRLHFPCSRRIAITCPLIILERSVPVKEGERHPRRSPVFPSSKCAVTATQS
eukprot:1594056-Pleurochrysis_carterae.AAC.1